MPKSIDIALVTAKSQPVTTTSYLIRIGPLPDGTTYLRMTSKDKDEVYDFATGLEADGLGAQTFYASTGLQLTTIEATNDLSVDNAEIQTLVPVYPMPGITEDMVRRGDLDTVPYVVIEHDCVNGGPGEHEIMASGVLGACRIEQGLVAIPELRSWSQLLNQTGIISQTSLDCRTHLGTQRGQVREYCGYDVTPLWETFTVTNLGSEDIREFFVDVSHADNYFQYGQVTWLTGDNAGTTQEIESDLAATGGSDAYVSLRFTTRMPIQIGDTGKRRPGCSLKVEGNNGCRFWWGEAWGAHFRGEPNINIGDSPANSIPGVHVPTSTGGTGEPPPTPTPVPPAPDGGAGSPGSPTVRTRGTTVVTPTLTAGSSAAAANTAAINAAYASLPGPGANQGGTVRIPAGSWWIDPNTAVKPLDYTLLDLETNNATLQEIYTATDHKYGIWVQGKTNVEIAGGTLIGYRTLGGVPAGTTAEWGHVIGWYASNHGTIRNTTLKNGQGDGMSIGGGSDDVWIDNIVSTNNRRQGISVTYCTNIKITNSELSYTNGTAPQAGIDIEPDSPSSMATILIDNCHIHHNTGPGIQAYKRTSGVTITNNVIEYNSFGVYTDQSTTGTITSNTIRHNKHQGVKLYDATASYTIGGSGATENTFFNNNTASRGVVTTGTTTPRTGQSSATADHINVASTCTGTSVLTNLFGP